MESAQNNPTSEITRAIFARLTIQWEAWKNKDAASNDAVISDDFHSISTDGITRTGKPTAQQMNDQPISAYKLSEFRVVPVGTDTALVTYLADVTTPGNNAKYHFAVGESWVKRNGQWFIRAFSGTILK
jgi:hypothetical protein